MENQSETLQKNEEAELLDELLLYIYYGFNGISPHYIEGTTLDAITPQLSKKLQTYMQANPEKFKTYIK